MGIIQKYKEIKVTKWITESYKCDFCGKIHEGDKLPTTWHDFTASHSEWGNDSCDSVQNYIACSPECYIKLLEDATDYFHEYRTAEIDGYTVPVITKLIQYIKELQ